MYAVMGITGQVGGVVAETLLAKGKQVRAIVRNPGKAAAWRDRGAEIAVADYNDPNTLKAAFEGTEGVFAMLPPYFAPEPGFPEIRAILKAVRQALTAAAPPKAVYLSSIGAQRDTGIGLITSLHILEEELRSLSLPAAFLRAGWFMENSAWDIPSVRGQGKLFSFLQPLDKQFPLAATADIGRIAAETLLQTWTGNRVLEIAGPKRYSPNDLAAAFAHVLQRPVEAVAVPRDTWVDTFVAQGTPADRTAYRVEMLDAFNSGWIDFGVPGTEHLSGTVSLEKALALRVARSQRVVQETR
ncbi:MAG TPA: NmrA family NAD(P)-binding protein [Bryobacteraceae bacterium]|nr:NmrA family NAD(P)-binding protein [Bryobacteraceae bacterium]